MSVVGKFILLVAVTTVSVPSVWSQERYSQTAANGSLYELRDKRRVWLMVRRSGVLDARGSSQTILQEIYKPGSGQQTYPRTFNQIAKKLNKYMRQHGSISAAQDLSDADFIIFFNVLEVRRPLGTPYVYGELYVILNASSKPRILWKSRQTGGMFVEDAINDLIRDMKDMRGER